MKWSGGTPCRAEWSFLTPFWYGEDWPPLFDYWDGMGARLRGAGSRPVPYQRSGRLRRGGENTVLREISGGIGKTTQGGKCTFSTYFCYRF